MNVISIKQAKISENELANDCGLKLYRLNRPFADMQQQATVLAVLAPQQASKLHYHKVMEETYHILSGHPDMVIDDERQQLNPGDTVTIFPNQKHQMINATTEAVEFISTVAPLLLDDEYFL